jgi:predicted GIY-YIG superfamily endonuclease
VSLENFLKQYSKRAWVYRQDIGWVWDDLTPDELAEFRATPRQRIETVRVPVETPCRIYYGNRSDERTIDELSEFRIWFAYCTMTKIHPRIFTLFRLYWVGNERTESWDYHDFPINPENNVADEMMEYDLGSGVYAVWLWNDQVEFCRELGCDILVHHGHGWGWGNRELTPPTKVAPRPRYQERAFVYALINPLTQEVFYIGQSNNPQQRFVEHLRDTSNSTKVETINHLQEQGYTPTLYILEEVDGAIALEREQWWMRFYEAQGLELTNIDSQLRVLKALKARVDISQEKRRLTQQRKQARKHGQADTLTYQEWYEILAYFCWKCAYCAKKPFETLDYLIPFKQGGGMTADNCIPTCYVCKTANKRLSEGVEQAFRNFLNTLSDHDFKH